MGNIIKVINRNNSDVGNIFFIENIRLIESFEKLKPIVKFEDVFTGLSRNDH